MPSYVMLYILSYRHIELILAILASMLCLTQVVMLACVFGFPRCVHDHPTLHFHNTMGTLTNLAERVRL